MEQQINKQQLKDNKLKQAEELFNKFFENKDIKDLLPALTKGFSYSAYNTFYLYMQSQIRNEEFTGIFKSFNNWKKDKVFILAGQKAFKVLVPIIKSVEKTNTDGQVEEKQFLSGFIEGNVFQINQTNSKEYENYKKVENEKLYKRINNFDITDLKNKVKVKINYKDENCRGYFNPINKEITIGKEGDNYTLIHEIGHFYTTEFATENKLYDYAYGELLAELFSYLYLLNKDYDVKEFNFNYSNIWTTRITDLKFKSFMKFFSDLNKIQKLIKGLI